MNEREPIPCENNWCIYNRGLLCLLSSIDLDELGICRTCTMVDMDAEELEARKAQQLAALLTRHEGIRKLME